MISIYHTFSTQKRHNKTLQNRDTLLKWCGFTIFFLCKLFFHCIILQIIWKCPYWKPIWFILISQRQLEYKNKSWCIYCLKNNTIFRDTSRNQDSSSWEKRCKNFQSGITFSSSLTTSLKLQYETKHGLSFVCLFGWFYLSVFSCSHRYSKSYDTPLLFVFKHQSMLPTTVIHSTCIFFNYILWFNQKLKGKTVGEIYGLYYQATPA